MGTEGLGGLVSVESKSCRRQHTAGPAGFKRNVRRGARKLKGLSRVYARGEVDLETVRSVVASFTGYMAHCKGRRSAESALRRLVLVRPPEEEGENG